MGRTAKAAAKSAAKAAAAAAKSESKDAKRAAKDAKREAKDAKGAARKAAAASQSAAKAAAEESRAATKSADAAAKSAKKSAKKATKGSRAAAKAESAALATKPARAIGTLSDPKLAKRAVTVGKVLAPALAPVVLRAAAQARGALDTRRAHRLGVPVTDVGFYRGPTGTTRARLDGLKGSVADLGNRRDNDLQTKRFVDVATARLNDLTAATDAAASLGGPQRREMLRAIGVELDRLGADLMGHLLPPRR